ncbi:FecR family protein [Pseudomonas sp. AK106]
MNAVPDPTADPHTMALNWLSVLHNQPTIADQARFSRWLHADPAHAEAYAQAQVVWELSEEPAATLAAEDAAALNALLRKMDAPKPRRLPRWGAALAMAACLVLMISAGLGWNPQRWAEDLNADYVSAPGQVRTLILSDGSQVTMDADSAIAVHFGDGERHVELRRGAAFFQVTHTGEPFVVDGGRGETRVLGTQFEVRLQPPGAQITVLSGRVGVKAAADAPQQILTAGQRARYDRERTGAPQSVDSESQLAWRQGWLNYARAPLADVISDLNRYYPGRIILLNDQLAAKTVSGSFPSRDPQAVLAALKSVVGFEQYQALGRVIVIR